MNAPPKIDTDKAALLADAMEVGERLRELEAMLTTPKQKRVAKVLHGRLEKLRGYAKHLGMDDGEVTTLGGGGTDKA
jgi:hypothetical protein